MSLTIHNPVCGAYLFVLDEETFQQNLDGLFSFEGFTRPPLEKSLSGELRTAKNHFEKGGWSYRSAAPVLGVSYQHLSEVLNGGRESSRLLAAVLQLPTRSTPKKSNHHFLTIPRRSSQP